MEIEASVERVWETLTDFPSFPSWNPFIRRIEGDLRVGSRLEVFIQSSGTKGMGFRPTLRRLEPGRELRWLGRLGIPGLFDGEHIFEIEPAGAGRTRFTHREVFRGLLVPLLSRSLDRDTTRGFEEMNRALKERAEHGDHEGRRPGSADAVQR